MSDAFEVVALELLGSAALLESTGKLTEKVCGLRNEARTVQLAD